MLGKRKRENEGNSSPTPNGPRQPVSWQDTLNQWRGNEKSRLGEETEKRKIAAQEINNAAKKLEELVVNLNKAALALHNLASNPNATAQERQHVTDKLAETASSLGTVNLPRLTSYLDDVAFGLQNNAISPLKLRLPERPAHAEAPQNPLTPQSAGQDASHSSQPLAVQAGQPQVGRLPVLPDSVESFQINFSNPTRRDPLQRDQEKRTSFTEMLSKPSSQQNRR